MADEHESEDGGIVVSSRLLWLLILGIALVFVGVVVLFVVSLVFSSSSSVGVVVFIGPFPIVFGSGPNAGLLIIIGIILAALSVVLFLVMNKRRG
ncbi:MAG: TIGR00304 family membrane protein [Candidatus Bathyarchaeia archaeon]